MVSSLVWSPRIACVAPQLGFARNKSYSVYDDPVQQHFNTVAHHQYWGWASPWILRILKVCIEGGIE